MRCRGGLMSTRDTIGYCPSCLQNIHHSRRHRSQVGSEGEQLKFGFWRVGPWYCCRCERKSFFLRFPNSRRPTSHWPRSEGQDRGAEAVGNFIRSDNSLVLRQKRSSRYSQKFRDGVVQRITTGKGSISQLCVELKVTESDLVAWIGDLLQRRQDRVDELSMMLKAYSQTNAHAARLGDQTQPLFDDEGLIEGSYEPRHET